jgi:homoserine kinase
MKAAVDAGAQMASQMNDHIDNVTAAFGGVNADILDCK